MAADKRTVNMSEGPLFGKIIRFTLPLVLMNALQLLYNAADMIVVGRFDGDLSVAAVGATTPLINLIVNIFIGLSVGVNVCVGNSIGARRTQETKEVIAASVLLGALSGLAVAVLGVGTSSALLAVMKTPGDVFGDALLYARIYFLGAPANLLYNFAAAVFRAKGDTKRPMYILLVCGSVNVMLNLLFVALLGMGVFGVALATVISQYASAVTILLLMVRDGDLSGLLSRIRCVRGSVYGNLLSLGLPAGIQSSVFSLSNMIIQTAINSFGAEAVAGNTAASNIDTFSYIAFNAFQTTCVAFAAQNCGAKNMKRVERVFGICMVSAVAVAILTGWGIYLFSDALLDFYLPEKTAAISFGAVRMKYICIPYFLLAMMDVTVGVLRGLGSSLLPTVISVIGSCGLRTFWIFTVFEAHRTPDVLYLSFPLAWLVTFLALLAAYCFVRKKRASEFVLRG